MVKNDEQNRIHMFESGTKIKTSARIAVSRSVRSKLDTQQVKEWTQKLADSDEHLESKSQRIEDVTL